MCTQLCKYVWGQSSSLGVYLSGSTSFIVRQFLREPGANLLARLASQRTPGSSCLHLVLYVPTKQGFLYEYGDLNLGLQTRLGKHSISWAMSLTHGVNKVVFIGFFCCFGFGFGLFKLENKNISELVW